MKIDKEAITYPTPYGWEEIQAGLEIKTDEVKIEGDEYASNATE